MRTAPKRAIPLAIIATLACGRSDAPATTTRSDGIAEAADRAGELSDRSIHVTPVAARKLLAAGGGPIVLDVRTSDEFAAGHLADAENIDIRADDFDTKIAALDRNQAYLVHCTAGVPRGRSLRAVAKLTELEFAKIYHLDGGFAAWQKADLPIVR